jgi:hypothetical protein
MKPKYGLRHYSCIFHLYRCILLSVQHVPQTLYEKQIFIVVHSASKKDEKRNLSISNVNKIFNPEERK